MPPPSRRGTALAFSTAEVLAGIARRFRPHDMRHSFASRLASETVALQVISTALGHSTITLTQRYAKPNADPSGGSPTPSIARMRPQVGISELLRSVSVPRPFRGAPF